jgi:hypothetical protein
MRDAIADMRPGYRRARQYLLGRPGNLLEVVEVRFALCAEVKRAIEIEVALKRLSFPLGLAT